MTRNLLVAALLLGTTQAVTAQPAPTPAPAPTPDDAKKAEAKKLYDQGITHYNLGEYDQAVAAFRQAYAMTSAPGLLFNIAQAFRLAKNYEQASHFYETYLRLKPDASNRADVEARIAEMNTMIEEQKKLGGKAPVGTVPPEGDGGGKVTTTQTPTTQTPTTQTPTQPEVPKQVDETAIQSGQKMKLIGLTTMAVGGASLLTGVIFGSMAKSAESDLEKLNAGGMWDQDKYNAGRRNNRIAITTLVIGGVAAVAGGAIWFLGSKKVKDAQVALVPNKGGGTFAVGWDF